MKIYKINFNEFEAIKVNKRQNCNEYFITDWNCEWTEILETLNAWSGWLIPHDFLAFNISKCGSKNIL